METAQDCQLIIFDCDGVLVDSEPISMDLLLEMVRAAGGDMPHKVAYERFLGRSIAKVVEELEQRQRLEITDHLLENLRLGLYDRLRKELQPIPGLKDALCRLSQPVCVASSSQPERIKLSLSVTGLSDRFGSNVFSASMVKRGKPEPDLFLFAAEKMGVEPRDCVVVEDSPTGITAAKRAGMRVIAFMGGSHVLPAGLEAKVKVLTPDCTLHNMNHLP